MGTPIIAIASRREMFWKRGDTAAFHVVCSELLRAATPSSQCADCTHCTATRRQRATALIFIGMTSNDVKRHRSFCETAYVVAPSMLSAAATESAFDTLGNMRQRRMHTLPHAESSSEAQKLSKVNDKIRRSYYCLGSFLRESRNFCRFFGTPCPSPSFCLWWPQVTTNKKLSKFDSKTTFSLVLGVKKRRKSVVLEERRHCWQLKVYCLSNQKFTTQSAPT